MDVEQYFLSSMEILFLVQYIYCPQNFLEKQENVKPIHLHVVGHRFNPKIEIFKVRTKQMLACRRVVF